MTTVSYASREIIMPTATEIPDIATKSEHEIAEFVSVQYQHDLKIIQKVLDSFFVQIWKFYIGIIVCHKSMMCAL